MWHGCDIWADTRKEGCAKPHWNQQCLREVETERLGGVRNHRVGGFLRVEGIDHSGECMGLNKNQRKRDDADGAAEGGADGTGERGCELRSGTEKSFSPTAARLVSFRTA